VNPNLSPLTKIFYLALASLTLLAAAVQWLPDEGFPPDIDLGAKEARAQSPRPTAPPGIAPVSVPGLAPPAATVTPANADYPATPYQPQPVYVAQQPVPAAIQPPVATQPSGLTTGEYSTQPWTPPTAPPTGAPMQPVVAGQAITPTSTITAPPGSSAILIPSMPAGEPPAQEVEGTRIIATVGSDVILAGEVLASVNAYLARNGIDPNDPQVREQKDELMKMRLKQIIETRTIVNEARRKIPEEGYNKAMAKFDEEFMRSIAPKMARERKLPDIAALEAQLKKDGTTLDREKQNFAEMVLSQSWVSQNVHVSPDVPHAEMLQYYQSRAADFDIPAQARWEQITVRFDSFPTKADAYSTLAWAGNQVLQGRPFADVARQISQGSTAAQGGAQPWTKKGSLVSKSLDQALFELPVNTLSPILEDERSFHIVRVVERQEAGKVPFTDAQVEIRKKISEQRAEAAKKELVEKIKAKTVVWTIYDPPGPTTQIARPPAAASFNR
jgi:parvulin-like peptidyl-prolyl isomerase